LIEYDQNSLKLKESDELLSLRVRANLTLIEPHFGPWRPYTTPKVGSIWRYFLDFSLNPKLDPFFGDTDPNVDPGGPPQPDFGP
jgi:hypothetical protein